LPSIFENLFGKKKREDEKIEEKVESSKEYLELEDTEEIIAVISTAIAAYLGEPANGFYVKAIRRVPNTTPIWGMLGRQEQAYSRL